MAPGRVDSPPTSTMSAPSSIISSPRETARSGSSHRPPSENESGVTLRIPMTRARSDEVGSVAGGWVILTSVNQPTVGRDR